MRTQVRAKDSNKSKPTTTKMIRYFMAEFHPRELETDRWGFLAKHPSPTSESQVPLGGPVSKSKVDGI